MADYNPYYIDEIVGQAAREKNHFGLISGDVEAGQEELHGYEVTMSGRLVLPQLNPHRENEKRQTALGTAWETR
ncbi:MAG: hypothetical protein ACKVX9_04975 [Blastocatellia bacterium]